MGETFSNSTVNPVIVLLLAIISPFGFWFFWVWGPFWTFVIAHFLLKAPKKRLIGSVVWSILPVVPLIVNLDHWMLAKKLANGETLDEMHHEIAFLGNLPLLKE